MQYIGITTGPIGETMEMTSTPAGLWFASYFFSTVVRDICKGLLERGYEILTLPEGHQPGADPDHGIGTYHDRIYAMKDASPDAIQSDLDAILEQVLSIRAEETASSFQQAGSKGSMEEIKEFLRGFLQIHYAMFPEEETTSKGIARTLADALDGTELSQQSCLEQSRSYIRQMIRGTKEDSNRYLRFYPPLVQAASDSIFPLAWQEGESVRLSDLKQIARGAEKKGRGTGKARNYFAIVQCDGDSMGKAISSDEEVQNGQLEQQQMRIREFSRLCMEYTTSSSRLVTDYGGAVIYAGGDDLLFLAPVRATLEGSACSNIWELCREIGRNFDDIFKNADAEIRPTISIGMSIQYHKFPLYEAFRDARSLLFENAKNFSTKNNLAVHLRKASGQSVGLICRMETASQGERLGIYDAYLDFLQAFCTGEDADDKERDQLMHSAIYHMEEQRKLFQVALNSEDDAVLRNTLENAFDHPGQGFGKSMLDNVAKLAWNVKKADAANAICNMGDARKDAGSLDILTSMLRLAKFLVEEERS